MAQQNEDNLQFSRFIELESIDSTNNYALDLARAKNLTDRQSATLHGCTVFAHEQREGKGQRGKRWSSASGENVQMSLILTPHPLKLHRQFVLSAMIALAVRDFMAEKSGKEFYIKWPNDIYFQDRKAGGILIENIISGNDWKWAVAGIGLNINQTEFDPALPNPVSLKQIAGREFDCLELARELSIGFFNTFENYFLGNTSHPEPRIPNPEPRTPHLLSEYNKHLYKRGQKVKLKKDNRVFEAVIKEVAENGQLIVETAIEERFDFGEIGFII